MFSSRKWQQFALIANLLGTAFLFYSFQATSSDFKLITAKNDESGFKYALCVNDVTLIASDGHGMVGYGRHECPTKAEGHPAAVVNIEHPAFEELAFILLLGGFLVQLLGVPTERTIAIVQKELKLLQAQERSKRSSR